MADKYKISPINQVPTHIKRPPYVGQKPQHHPSLDAEIEILSTEQISGLRVASNLAARTLSPALSEVKVGMSLDELDLKVHNFIV